MGNPGNGSVQLSIPSGLSVACFGNVQAKNTQQVVMTDANNNVIFTATGSNEGGGTGTPVPMSFAEGHHFFSFMVPSNSGGAEAYTLTVSNAKTGNPEKTILKSVGLNLSGQLFGTVWILMCDDENGNSDYNDCIFYVQACAQAD